MIKICPACGTENPENAPVCLNCLEDLSVVSPTSKEKEKSIKLLINGKELTIKSGDTLGRQAVGSEIFKDFPTVSRKHAKISFENEEWFIEDLNSTNGTYVNGEKIKEKRKIKTGDKINLSMSLEAKVIGQD
ncbi:FHA domain-containing protein [Persephonella sp. KM09-Lau-8]|uniref:FHA domain-containing protein n=1 Tax=Persephonella sp. KM09-Lau-8 TaxID=1158345 RepID=UPI00049538B2|nr:FHA domain-containing protein [Persephonella sp. KM09-Lau-8]